ncbi:hypothetical protein B0H67DRAFT_566903 [Lasiosphaeris hirsuta]|uniref:Secreted protein n=1 Tax=Lasiosphaeris hirsuta TaxID=260670 RepID=A0AA40BDF3_9PEZI|nr:hypothetical protein B0H67DRAFT_566903 [Lasiosphaeris hirsuta]
MASKSCASLFSCIWLSTKANLLQHVQSPPTFLTSSPNESPTSTCFRHIFDRRSHPCFTSTTSFEPSAMVRARRPFCLDRPSFDSLPPRPGAFTHAHCRPWDVSVRGQLSTEG